MIPSLVPIACGKRNPGQQAMGERQMIAIGCRSGIIAKLDCLSSRPIEFGNLQTIFTEAMIKLGEYCEVQRDAVFVQATLDIVELFTCSLQVA